MTEIEPHLKPKQVFFRCKGMASKIKYSRKVSKTIYIENIFNIYLHSSFFIKTSLHLFIFFFLRAAFYRLS
jgi:hypothetical protein